MKLSLYTIVRDGLYHDLHVEAMLRHHLPLADEIIVNEGFSSDNTYDRITAIDPKVVVFREKWDVGHASGQLFAQCKNRARARCTGEWCILLDCDEFIPEWEFSRIREELEHAREPILSLRHKQFYGNYKVLHARPEKVRWFVRKRQIHRNLPEMSVVGDGSHVSIDGRLDVLTGVDPDRDFEAHHMGQVRSPARLRQKWKIQHKLKQDSPRQDRTPGILFDLAPHDWFDKEYLDDLRTYEGPFVKAVREAPDEFIRDGMKLYEYLNMRDAPRS
jgi:glycosyltransferase involved in cell wall biosynthesis